MTARSISARPSWPAPPSSAEIASQDRGPKLLIFKKRRRKHYRRKNGHRQDLTSVTITGILTGGETKSAPKNA